MKVFTTKETTRLNMEWIEQEHPIFGDHGIEPAVKTEALIGRSGVFPRKQWRSGEFSIIEPSDISFGQYELYPVDGDIERFSTLEEAQSFAEKLPLTTDKN